MALLRLGSKSDDSFRREGHSWHCTTGLPSDLTIEVGEVSFFLHKFPLLSRSGLLKKLIADTTTDDADADASSHCVLKLHDIPGGDKTFDLVARFCYGVQIEVTASNVVPLRCAAEHLQMNENHGEGNLIAHTDSFLNNEILSNWKDSIKALQTCCDEEIKSCYAQELHIVSRCIDSLTIKACSNSNNPFSGEHEADENPSLLKNEISSETTKEPTQNCDDDGWWHEDLSLLSLNLYKQLILSIESKGMKQESVAGSLIHYIRKHVPMVNKMNANQGTLENTATTTSEAEQRELLEEIVALFPNKKSVTTCKNLLRLLRTAMILHASPSCIDNLEKRVGTQLDQAELVDLLIPNVGQSIETLYDVECFQRIIDHFVSMYLPSTAATSPCISIIGEESLIGGAEALTPMTIVANLVDGYLAEVALDVNFKLPKFQALASAIPDYARPLDDALYHAIDVYLKAHPWLIDSEREQFCRLMNCQKLSLEASTHAAQNERLPLRVIVQVLFFEQLRLRTSVSSWLFVENVDNTQNLNENLGPPKSNNGQVDGNLRDRVSELEKECSSIRNELKNLGKTKRGWRILPRFFFRKSS